MKANERHSVWWTHFPYALMEYVGVDDGKPCWVFVNRNYVPIGFMTGDWVYFNEHPVGIRPARTSVARWNKLLATLAKGGVPGRWLYDGKTAPWHTKAAATRYLALLAELGRLQVTHVRVRPLEVRKRA